MEELQPEIVATPQPQEENLIRGQSSLSNLQVSMINNNLDEVEQTSAFPLPPHFYLKYSDENFKLLEPKLNYLTKRKAENKQKVEEEGKEGEGSCETKIDSVKLKQVLPPKLPSHNRYKAFQNGYTLEDTIPSLESQGIRAIYKTLPDGGIHKPKETLARLNYTLLKVLKNIVNQLARSDQGVDMEVIYKELDLYQTTLLNLVDITNRLRPYQARLMIKEVYRIRLERVKKLVELNKSRFVKNKIVIGDLLFNFQKEVMEGSKLKDEKHPFKDVTDRSKVGLNLNLRVVKNIKKRDVKLEGLVSNLVKKRKAELTTKDEKQLEEDEISKLLKLADKI